MIAPAALLTLSLCAPAIAQVVAAPNFVDGDLSQVSCRIARRIGGDSQALLLVDVQNRGRTAFEPITFRLSLPKGGRRDASEEIDLHRAPLPHLEHDTFRDDSGTKPRTTCRVRNLLDVPVDAVFRARYTRPWDVDALLTLQLAPSEERDWQIDDFASSLSWQPLHHGQGAKIDRLELVDWSVRLPGDRALAQQRLLDVHDRWLRWTGEPPTVSGRFEFRSRYSPNPPVAASGRFVLDSAGGARVEHDDGSDREAAVRSALTSAFDDLVRPAENAAPLYRRSSTTGFVNRPIPSISIVTSSPARR